MANVDTVPPAAWLYPGSVMHARLKPTMHRFTYTVFSLLIDVDRLADAGRQSRLFSINRWNVISFHESDHGGDDREKRRRSERAAASLPDRIRAKLDRAGCPEAGAHITLLCYPRIFGYVFNPLSVFYCRDAQGDLRAIIYEVRNTFGGLHSYVIPVSDGELSEAGLRQACDKDFYVSPFIGATARYNFRLTEPDETVRVRILETDPDGPLLAATFAGTRLPLTTSSILAVLRRMPLMTQKVIAGIHWEALWLWLKGVPYQPPAQPKTLDPRRSDAVDASTPDHAAIALAPTVRNK